MKIRLSELRVLISEEMTSGHDTGALAKFKFLRPDTMNLFKQFIMKYSTDLARLRAVKRHQAGDTSGGDSENDVKEIASDAEASMAAHLEELTRHLAGSGQQKKAPPPRRS